MKAYLISHTHWDREWYQTFQDYRARLVIMLDELIGFMEKNPAFKSVNSKREGIGSCR